MLEVVARSVAGENAAGDAGDVVAAAGKGVGATNRMLDMEIGHSPTLTSTRAAR